MALATICSAMTRFISILELFAYVMHKLSKSATSDGPVSDEFSYGYNFFPRLLCLECRRIYNCS